MYLFRHVATVVAAVVVAVVDFDVDAVAIVGVVVDSDDVDVVDAAAVDDGGDDDAVVAVVETLDVLKFVVELLIVTLEVDLFLVWFQKPLNNIRNQTHVVI